MVECCAANAEGGMMNEIFLPAAILRRVTAVFMGALLVVLSSCQQCPADPGSLFSKGLQRDAWRTVTGYNQALLAGTEKSRTEISPNYWEPSIQRLHPVKVYIHRANLVVVQRFRDAQEQGTYVYLPISSFMPVSSWFFKHEVDGFVFRPAWGNGVFHFTRTALSPKK
jgi:hypothetical protein